VSDVPGQTALRPFSSGVDVDWLARARAVSAEIEAEAEASEQAGSLTRRTVDALAGAGLFGLAVPKCVGGAEAGLERQLAVWEEVSRADGSAGWCLMAGGTSSAFAGAYCAPEAAREMFGGRDGVVHAGQFAPRGQGVAQAGGFRVSGEYSFGSGCAHAAWISAGFIPLYDGQPRMLESGLPEMRVAFVPREKVEFRDNWNVVGLQGTGSFDYALPEQLVPEGFTLPLFTREPRQGGDLYRLGIMVLTAAGHAGFALGVGRRALDEVTRLARQKVRMGASAPVAESAIFQRGLARAEAQLRAARLLVYDAFADVERSVREGSEPSLEQRALLRTATTWATEAAEQVADFAYRSGGTDPLRSPSVLQRAWRDIHAGTQHAFVSDAIYTDSAKVWLGTASPHLPL
jgi:alkylation response protein AidB-like acyl-CoA dehydrogenase